MGTPGPAQLGVAVNMATAADEIATERLLLSRDLSISTLHYQRYGSFNVTLKCDPIKFAGGGRDAQPTAQPEAASTRGAKTEQLVERDSRQARGYGRAHELMREQVLREEPLCRPCTEAGRVAASVIADHIVPKVEGGSDDRGNYQGICRPCHIAKTARESARARPR
jgi:5-methylcytosine-specific restriction protein A